MRAAEHSCRRTRHKILYFLDQFAPKRCLCGCLYFVPTPVLSVKWMGLNIVDGGVGVEKKTTILEILPTVDICTLPHPPPLPVPESVLKTVYTKMAAKPPLALLVPVEVHKNSQADGRTRSFKPSFATMFWLTRHFVKYFSFLCGFLYSCYFYFNHGGVFTSMLQQSTG